MTTVRRLRLNPPVEAGRCRQCGTDLVAVAKFTDGPVVEWFDWRHKIGLRKPCPYVTHAEPGNGHLAAMRVNAELLSDEIRDEVRDALSACLARRAD